MIRISNELIRNVLFWVQQKRWLIIIAMGAILMYHLPYPGSISPSGYRTIILGVIVISLIITEPIPLPAVALLIAVLEVSFHIAPATEVAKTYMNDSVFFIMGSVMKKSFLSYKNDEWERYHQAVTDWEVKEYLRLY